MSRAMNMKLSIEDVTRKCEAAGVSISAIEATVKAILDGKEAA